jgi:hypothetical protein
MYLCNRGIDFASFYYFDIWCWNCSDSVVYFDFHFISQNQRERTREPFVLSKRQQSSTCMSLIITSDLYHSTNEVKLGYFNVILMLLKFISINIICFKSNKSRTKLITNIGYSNKFTKNPVSSVMKCRIAVSWEISYYCFIYQITRSQVPRHIMLKKIKSHVSN